MSAVAAAPAPEDAQTIGIAEVARIYGVSRDTVYLKARAGEIPGFKFGRTWRFWPSEVREALRPKRTDLWAQPARARRARRAR